MLSTLSKKMTTSFISRGIVAREEQDIYAYSFEIFLSTILNFLALCIISLVTGMVVETAVYLLAFLPLRRLVGGFHAKNHLRCFLTLMASYAGFLVLVQFFPIDYVGIANLTLVILSAVIVFVLAPVADSNKPLSDQEVAIFRQKSRMAILVFSALAILIFAFIPRKELSFSFALGMLSIALSLVAGRIKNVVQDKPLFENQ